MSIVGDSNLKASSFIYLSFISCTCKSKCILLLPTLQPEPRCFHLMHFVLVVRALEEVSLFIQQVLNQLVRLSTVGHELVRSATCGSGSMEVKVYHAIPVDGTVVLAGLLSE